MLESGGNVENFELPQDAGETPVFYTFEDVEAALVEAHALWRRSPRVGHVPLRSAWPVFAQRGAAGDYDARGGDLAGEVARPLPLSRAEVDRRDRVTEWLLWVPTALNRRIVGLATLQLAHGDSRISWRKVALRLRGSWERGVLPRRYERAVGAICAALNHPAAAAMVKAGAGPKAIAEATGLSFAEAHALARQLRGG